MAAASQTITERIRCQRKASRCPIKDISSGSAASLLRIRLKKFFLSDDDVANVIIWMAKVKQPLQTRYRVRSGCKKREAPVETGAVTKTNCL